MLNKKFVEALFWLAIIIAFIGEILLINGGFKDIHLRMNIGFSMIGIGVLMIYLSIFADWYGKKKCLW